MGIGKARFRAKKKIQALDMGLEEEELRERVGGLERELEAVSTSPFHLFLYCADGVGWM